MMRSESAVSDTTIPTSNATGGGKSESPDEKVAKDLATLEEQIDLCQSMLSTEASVDTNEALLAVIGFLEACVPRMVELIEAAAQGALGEELLEKCLVVNDRLCRTLEDVDEEDPAKRSCTKAAAAATSEGSGAAAKARTDTEKEFDDLLGSSDSPPASPKQPPGGKGKSTGEEEGTPADPFAGEPDVFLPTPAAGSTGTAAAVPAKKEGEDLDAEFDDFLKERASNEKGGN